MTFILEDNLSRYDSICNLLKIIKFSRLLKVSIYTRTLKLIVTIYISSIINFLAAPASSAAADSAKS